MMRLIVKFFKILRRLFCGVCSSFKLKNFSIIISVSGSLSHSNSGIKVLNSDTTLTISSSSSLFISSILKLDIKFSSLFIFSSPSPSIRLHSFPRHWHSVTQTRAGTPLSRSSSMPAFIELYFTAGTRIRATDLIIQIPSYYQCASLPRYIE